jgi:hypothetical protein
LREVVDAALARKMSNNDKEAGMRFVVLVHGSPESEAGEMPSTEAMAAMANYNQDLVKAGVMLAGDGLYRPPWASSALQRP